MNAVELKVHAAAVAEEIERRGGQLASAWSADPEVPDLSLVAVLTGALEELIPDLVGTRERYEAALVAERKAAAGADAA